MDHETPRPGRGHLRKRAVGAVAAAAAIVGVLFAPAAAHASWDFNHDHRTGWLGGPGWKILKNEDEFGWPRAVVNEAIVHGSPRFVDTASHRYKRVRFKPRARGGKRPLKATYRSSPRHWRGSPMIWFKITAYKSA